MSGPLIGRSLLELSQRLRKFRSLSLLHQIEGEPFVSPEEVERRQLRRVRELLAHAGSKVPYYRELFRSLGLKSSDIQTWDDYRKIPILTKDIIRQRQRDLIREDVPVEKLLPHHSGGSTGIPLSFFREREYLEISEAGTFRNLQACGWQPGEMIAFFWGGNDKIYAMSKLQFELRQTLRRMYQFDPFESGPEDMDRWLKRWKSLNPTVILGYSSTVARFAQHIEQRGAKVAPLKGVFTTAEKLYPEQREVISRVFQCRAYDCYGSSEVQNIAAECSMGRMHINADYVVLELDESASAPGEPAPFIVTSLRNWAMPFIRYRNEDCGGLEADKCTCGNNFPLMRLQIARVSDNFVMPNGRVIHGEFFTHLMYGSEGISTFQFHQTAPDSITLHIVPGPGSAEARERCIQSAVQQIQQIEAGSRIAVVVNQTDSIPLSSAGKHRFTRSDVQSANVQSANLAQNV